MHIGDRIKKKPIALLPQSFIVFSLEVLSEWTQIRV